MLADATARSWVGLVWMQAVLWLPQPIVVVSGGVVGFEACSLISWLRGLALPGIIATAEGYASPSTGDGHHANREGRRGSLIPFWARTVTIIRSGRTGRPALPWATSCRSWPSGNGTAPPGGVGLVEGYRRRPGDAA
jgi:hypothetical protein